MSSFPTYTVAATMGLSSLWNELWVWNPTTGLWDTSSLPKCLLTVSNCFREGISKTTMENSQSGNTRSKFILKGEKAAAKRESKLFFFFADFFIKSNPPGHVCGRHGSGAVCPKPGQGLSTALGTLRAQRARRIQGHQALGLASWEVKPL